MKLSTFIKSLKPFASNEPVQKESGLPSEPISSQVNKQVSDPKPINSDSSFIESLMAPPTIEEPDYDMTPFPFENKPYLCRTQQQVVHDTGQVIESSKFYYADHLAVDAVRKDVENLENLIKPEAIDIPTLPILETNFARVEEANRLMEFPENRVQLNIKPLTKTGRKAKYPVEILFSSYEKSSSLEYRQNGSHGTVSYFASGAVGKAEIHYWINHEHYGAYFKIIGGNLALNVLTYSNARTGDEVELYRAH